MKSTKQPPPAKRRRWRVLAALLLLAAYPLFVLGAVYAQVVPAKLEGGRHGPGDAYRHTLASAIVAYTLSPHCVEWVTQVMERNGEGSPGRAMDAHNNRIGAHIGASAASWQAMHESVAAAIKAGAVEATAEDQITWLPPSMWQDRLY